MKKLYFKNVDYKEDTYGAPVGEEGRDIITNEVITVPAGDVITYAEFSYTSTNGDDTEIKAVNKEVVDTAIADGTGVLYDTHAELITSLNTIRIRKQKYPSIIDQLDMQYHDQVDGTTTWKDAITKIKTDNPKPE